MSDAVAVTSPGPHGQLALALDAVVLDVGLAGVAIESETRLAPERKLVVRLGGAADTLELPGRVVWCFFHGTVPAASGEQRPLYRAGIEFADLLTPSAQRLVAFLEHQVEPGGETRLFGRFPVARSQGIRIETAAPFHCVEFDGDRVDVDVELGVEPAAGQRATLTPRGGGTALGATVAAVQRGEHPDAWRLSLELSRDQPAARAALRGVAFD
jgi:hypothetical protein